MSDYLSERKDLQCLSRHRTFAEWRISGHFSRSDPALCYETTQLDSTSQASLVSSDDGVQSWSAATPVADDHPEIGIQDPSIVELHGGTWLANFFRWKVRRQEPFGYDADGIGVYVVRSEDTGHTIIESLHDQLKNNSQIDHSRHQSPINFVVNLLAGLIAYSFQDKKPSLHLDPLLVPTFS